MKQSRHSWLGALAVALLSLCLAKPCAAARWQELGNAGSSLDKIYIDADSIQMTDGFRVVLLMTVYQAPRTNEHDITFDRHIQKLAVDCANRTYSKIQLVGLLGTKQVGKGPLNADWKASFTPLPNDPFTQRMLDTACSQPAAAAGIPAAAGVPAAGAPPVAAPGGQQIKVSTGSGIVLNEDGNILTDMHVVKACKSIAIKLQDTDPLPAKVDAADPKNDLVILKTVAGFGHPAEFRAPTKPAKLGESIGVIGYPLAGILSSEPKATFGQVNSVAGMGNDYTLLQISAPVQGGNSGGPVFDAAGNVVGVVVSQASLALVRVTGAVPQNVNFAIRSEVAQIFMSAHGVKFKVGDRQKKMETDELAALGQKSTVLVVCAQQ